MPVVDSHCHVSRSWYEPVETLLFQMGQAGVDAAILIQMMGQTDNSYQFDCVRRYPGGFASVVIVDADRPDTEDAVRRVVDQGASGIRLRATQRSTGDDPLAIWRVAAARSLPVSCIGSAADFAAEEFVRLVETVPDLTIVIEHLGSLKYTDHAMVTSDVVQRVFGLAQYPNVFMKLPGLGEFCRRLMPAAEPFPFEEPIPPYLEMAYQAFGSHRLMWGSDYPPVSSREGYRNALAFPRAHFASKSSEERELIFGGTAAAVFTIP